MNHWCGNRKYIILRKKGNIEMYKIEIHVFGVQSVYCNGTQIVFPYRKSEALFFAIAVEKSITRSRAIELLWADQGEAIAKKNLRNALYTVKKIFGFNIISSEQKSVLKFNDEIEIQNDYERFIEKENTELYTDTFMKGFIVKDADSFEQWLYDKQESVRKIYLAKMNQEIAKTAYEDIHKLELLTEKYLTQNPLDEGIYYNLMKAYAKNDMYYKGIEVYKKLDKILNEELGIAPNQDAAELYHDLSKRWLENATEHETDEGRMGFVQKYRFQELQRLFYLYTSFLEGTTSHILLCGKFKVGKSYLLNQFLADLDKENLILLRNNCLEAEKEFPLQLWIVLFSQLNDYVEKNGIDLPKAYTDAVNLLFPMLGTNIGTTFELSMDIVESSSFQSFRNGLIGILQYLARKVTIVITVENLQNIDRISFYILTMLMRINTPNILIIMTCVEKWNEKIEQTLVELENYGLIQKIEVLPLSDQQVEEYLEEIGEKKNINFSAQFKKEVCQYAQGNIGMIQEILLNYEKYKENFELYYFKDAMKKRWEELNASEQNLLNLVSIMEIGMSVEMMSKVYGEEFIHAFDSLYSLINKKIMEEVSYNHHVYFHFSSMEFKNYVYGNLEASKRQLYHNRIGMALEEGASVQDGNWYKRLIYHFGHAQNEEKVLYYRLCSLENLIVQIYDVYPIQIMSIYSLIKPEKHIEHIFNEIKEQLFQENFENSRYYGEMCTRYYYGRACYCISRGVYEEGKDLIYKGLNMDYTEQCVAYKLNFFRLMAYYGVQVQNLEILQEYVEKGIQLSKKCDLPFEESVFLRMYGLYQMMTGKYEESVHTLQDTLQKLKKQNINCQTKGINLAATYNYLGETFRRQKYFEEAKPYYVKALQICSENGCPQNATFYMNLATVYLGLKDEQEAFKMFLQADALYDASLMLKGRVITKSYLAVFYAKQGDMKKAIDYLKTAQKFTSYLKSPGENGIYYRILAQLLNYYGNVMKKYFPQDAEYYDQLGKDILKNVEGFYEKDDLYIKIE